MFRYVLGTGVLPADKTKKSKSCECSGAAARAWWILYAVLAFCDFAPIEADSSVCVFFPV